MALVRRAPSARVAIARAGALADPEFVPEEARAAFTAEIEAARDATVVELSPKDVERALRDAWRKPVAKVLDDLDLDAPLAVTPGAQVHRGELDGTAVAVKVRRPGLERAVRNDLALLDVLAAPLRAAFPRLDAAAVLRDAREQALDELDFEYEGSTLRRVGRALRGVPGVRVQRPHLDLTTPEVLVSDLLPGATLAAGARPADPHAAAHALAAVHRTATLGAGLAPVDPRPSHVVIGDDGELGLLGLGVARPVERERARLHLEVLAALAAGDADAFAAAAERTGIVEAGVAHEAHGLLRRVAGELLDGHATLDAGAVRALAGRGAVAMPGLAAVAMTAAPQPQDLALARMVGQLTSVLAHLGATADWPAVVLAKE